ALPTPAAAAATRFQLVRMRLERRSRWLRAGYGRTTSRDTTKGAWQTFPSPSSPDDPHRAEAGHEIDRLGADADRLVDREAPRVETRHGPVPSVCDPDRVCADGDCSWRVAYVDGVRGPAACRSDLDGGG